jgi:hypothetical protein
MTQRTGVGTPQQPPLPLIEVQEDRREFRRQNARRFPPYHIGMPPTRRLRVISASPQLRGLEVNLPR